jgi:hypothetical protein
MTRFIKNHQRLCFLLGLLIILVLSILMTYAIGHMLSF